MREIRAEMAASVWQMRVEVGQRVGPNDELMILESMKMEIPVVAQVRGTVHELVVAVGAAVQDGDVLALIQED